MNRQIRQLAGGLMVCYALLFVTLNYWQVGRQDELNARLDNTRAVRREFEQPRGEIVTADGVVIAQSVENPPGSDFRYQRQYPTGDLFAHISGYYTFAFGSTQLERSQNAVLTGETGEQQLRNLPGLITGADDSGTVVLTMRSDLQQVAKDALGEREGAVVLMDPRRGAIQAMWSYPSYDPNQVADPDFETAQAVLTFLQALPGDPLLANAYQQRYMPGSTFKILTTGIALTNGVTSPATVYPDESEWTPPQTDDPIENFGGTTCGGDLNEVFTRSCNIPFAQMAVELGPDRFVAGTQQWGMEEAVPIDMPRPAASTIGDVSDLDQELPALAIARLRPERGPDGPAAHGDGRVDDRQRRPDDEAVRDRRAAGQRWHRARVDLSGGVEDPDQPGRRGHDRRHDGQRRRDRHRQLLHRPRQRRPGGGQDRHRPAQRPRRARAVARLDRGLRPGRTTRSTPSP